MPFMTQLCFVTYARLFVAGTATVKEKRKLGSNFEGRRFKLRSVTGPSEVSTTETQNMSRQWPLEFLIKLLMVSQGREEYFNSISKTKTWAVTEIYMYLRCSPHLEDLKIHVMETK